MSDREFEARPSSFEMLASQIEQLRDGALDTVDQERLLEQLRDDPRARQFYVQYQLLHADLRATLEFDGGTAVSEDRAKNRPAIGGVPGSSVSMPMSPRVIMVLLVATTLNLGGYWGFRQWRKRPADIDQVATNRPVARVVATLDAAWSERASLTAGQSLASMPVQLQSGLAEIRFSSGASIVLQGPASCELESPSSVRLLHGRLSASVPERAIGFSVRTPLANIVDLGTEFAIHSTPAGNTDVHVFRGQVALGGSRLSGDSGHELLGAGNAKRFKGDGGEAEEFRADELAFVSYQEFEARRKAEQDSPYYRWLAQSYRIRRDPSLILYYTFDPSDPFYESILNRSGATAGRLDAYPGDALDPTGRPMRMPSGRWPAQRSLRFDSSRRQHLRVAHANELNITQSVSLAAWIRPTLPLLEPRAVIVSKTSATPSARKPNYEIGLRRKNRDTALNSGNGCVFYFQAGDQEIVTPEIAIVPGQWIFVAAVASSEATSLFVNGKRVAQMDSVKLIPKQGDLWIGGVPDTVQPGSEDNYFEGAIGELMLFRRTLTAEEIMTFFRSEMGPA